VRAMELVARAPVVPAMAQVVRAPVVYPVAKREGSVFSQYSA